ncbi:hypothetical protein F5Y19DRAFT_207425 [Xylariaceae sp. FL1651]|nr:hypothetical protein F5Y19DRAFT_207425 [Xylariaceae sp. FL1651]
MDIHMDLRVGFDEDFSFGGQSLSCSSSSGSFSSASTANSSQDPFTPTSGRSTPGLQPMLMEHDTVACGTSTSFGLTPPASAFGSYFPSDTKAEIPHYLNYEALSATPSRKASLQTSAMDFECAPMIPTPTTSQNNSLQSANPQSLGHYPFADQLFSPPLEFPPPPYSLENSTYDIAPSWTWPGESPVNFFERHNSPGTSTTLKEISLRERHNAPPPYFSLHDRKRLCVDGVQQKTTALHQVQQGYRVSKRNRTQKTTMIGGKPVSVFPKGLHRCLHEACVGRKPFKRQEHLKRHEISVHGDQEKINTICEFCFKKFNRKDNWRSHITLHTKKGGSGRTEYFEGAQAVLDEELRRTKQRNQPKKKTAQLKASARS